MKVAYYMPFKPLGHPNPSGDLITGTEIYNYLNQKGHQCKQMSSLRCRWIYYHPTSWIKLLREQRRIIGQKSSFKPDIWLTYHSYYKAPDLIGPYCSKRLNIPYAIFQGIYSTKRRKKLKTLPGFYLNRYSLLSANLIFTNKKRDNKNLQRLLPEDKICYIAPGIHTEEFTFSEPARARLRAKWSVTKEILVLATAMFRPGVKTEGLKRVIKSCSELLQQHINIKLVIAGDGSCREELQQYAEQMLPGKVIFSGRIPRNELYTVYSAADIFAFPGIDESLGMVYLEAQSCGLPVVAYGDWGASEAVINDDTGLLSSASEPDLFTKNIALLTTDSGLRAKMAARAPIHIRDNHELHKGYSILENRLSNFFCTTFPMTPLTENNLFTHQPTVYKKYLHSQG